MSATVVPYAVLGVRVEPRIADPAAALRAAVGLEEVMSRTEGDPDVVVALLDGPVAFAHPLLSAARVRATAADGARSCRATGSPACAHGTFIAGILLASRDSPVPGICPGCTLLSRPVFPERGSDEHPSASADDLADAIVDSVRSGARILNMSLATTFSSSAQQGLVHALSYAGRRGALVVAAAGNQSIVGGSVITRHPAVIPVVAIDRRGRPLGRSNLGASIGRRGISAPGEAIVSLDSRGGTTERSGTSAATAFVTGALALLWSLLPGVSATALRSAVAGTAPRRTVTPPILDAAGALRVLSNLRSR